MPLPKASDATRKHRLELANAKNASRAAYVAANTTHLPDGSVIYPDSPPGVGWVLKLTGYGNNKYLATKELALAHWRELTGLDFVVVTMTNKPGPAYRCPLCNMTLQSMHRHDFVICSCENRAYVDGGSDYLRAGWAIKPPELIEELPPSIS